jgi:putative ABC transport system permease protein
MLLGTVWMALREIRKNAMRSILTMLGVVIGVGAVVTLVTVGDGATASVTASISALGNNVLMVMPGSDRRPGSSGATGDPLEIADAGAIREIAGLLAVAPTASKQLLAVYGNKSWRTTVSGVTTDYLPARGYAVEKGRNLTTGEVTAGRAVCLIGATVARELFGSGDPLGAAVRLGRVSCTIIGVLGSKGAGMMGNDNDDLILLPIKAFQRRIAGNTNVAMIFVAVAEGRSTSSIKQQIEGLMRERRRIGRGAPDDFNVRDMQEIIETVSTTNKMMTALLGAVAAVSLLVGGIGIMNIMLVSVTERTREIGIRLAVGALGRDVLLQFLIEAITLSTLGGALGVILGMGGAYAITQALKMPFLVSPNMIVLAFAFSAFVGVLFGYLPARKAAHLDPIEALRHE